MAQTFPPGVTNWNTDVRRLRSKFLIHRRDNYALGVTLGRFIRSEQKELMILRNLTQ